ncbi:hypothetical protein PVAND_015089 [Polypedilum vanderplanki]|uniref:Cytochrome P450 n=1 Tax=Polypedilum vanderplanki TaxID=319348 RepID=A0A9J6BBL3_POLVA|nr:hypothetical protein PVAND_015089 [Polypedilum vanderplanki]
METFTFVLILFFLLLAWYYSEYRFRFQSISKFPGPKRIPFFGNALMFIGKKPSEILTIVEQLHREYGNVLCLMMGSQPEILLTSPEDVEVVLGSSKLIKKSDEYDFMTDWLGTGLLIASGLKWFQKRKITTPAFHLQILDQFVEIFDKHSAIFVKNLAKSEGHSIDVFQPITLCALDIICETAMGIEIHAQANSNSDYVRAVKEMSNLAMARSVNFFLRNKIIYKFSSMKRRQDKLLKILHGFTDDVIISRREELIKNQEISQNKKKKMAFLDVLLQSTIEGKPLSNMDIREEVDIFMFEGFDTTSSGIAFCLYNLAKYPAVQKKVFEEIIKVIGADKDKSVTLTNLNDLKYLEMVIKETLRLYPSVPAYGRKMVENVEINGKLIPRGTNIGIGPYFMARDASLWKNPLEFIPERFSTNESQYHPFLHVPFSAGPRNCVGQKFAMLEMKSVVSKILRNYEIQVDSDFKLVLLFEVILRPENGVFLKMIKRK